MKNDYLLKNGINDSSIILIHKTDGASNAPLTNTFTIEYNLEYNHNTEDILEHIIKEIICKSRKLKLEKLNENTK